MTYGEPGVGARRGSGDPPHFDYLGCALGDTPVVIISRSTPALISKSVLVMKRF